jgi:hypothetical protein
MIECGILERDGEVFIGLKKPDRALTEITKKI